MPLALMMLTWTLLIGSLWLGYSGRPWFFYGGVVIGIVALVGTLIAIGVCCNLSDSDSQFILGLLLLDSLAIGRCFRWQMLDGSRRVLASKLSRINH